ncbi:MAG: hypothetical protein ACJAUV_000705 [Flavobacteriales bacterium]|jgi:hypothetical protein
MKKTLLLMLAFASLTAQAQLLNADLETWTGTDPDSWVTLNFILQVDGDTTVFQETNNPGEGSSSALLVTGNCLACPLNGIPYTEIPGYMNQQVAIDYRPDSAFFLLKTGDANQGQYLINFDFTINTVIVGQSTVVSDIEIPTWSLISLPVAYDPNNAAMPDSMTVVFSSGYGLFFGETDYVGDEITVDMIAVSDENITDAIAESTISDLVVYPTLATEIVNFRMKNSGVVVVNVYDALGKVIDSELVKSDLLQLNVSSYQSGMYIYQVTNIRGQVIESGKFTKK